MIPKGPIYLHIRTDVLKTYQKGCKASLTNRITFADWLLKGDGSYFVKSVTNKEIVLVTNPIDIASSLLTDVESLFNHCFEHLQELACFYVDEKPRSDAWNVVTMYYFSFFTAQIFLRLVGTPTIYISHEQIQNLKLLGGVSNGGPGPGSYRLEKVASISVNQAEYKLKKTNNSKIHEATWTSVFTYIEKLISNPALSTTPDEVLFYKYITTDVLHNIYDGYGWPSVVRTKANYKAGFAYLNVDKDIKAKTKGIITTWKEFDSSKITDLLRTSVNICYPADKSHFSNHVKLMYDISQSLFLICRELYSELLERSDINKIWELKRSQFYKEMSFPIDEFKEITKTF